MAYIYKITDLTNGMIYIGETTQTIQTRWSGHLYKSRHNKDNSYLHNAIRAHGESNFIIEEVEQCSEAERFERETYYIKKYDCLTPKGYNILVAGRGSIKVPIELLLDAWEEGLNTKEIGEKYNIGRQVVAEHLKSNGITQEEIYKRQGERNGLRCARPVLQYDLQGNFIKRWISASSCKEKGYEQGEISSCCRQEIRIAYGYLWKYEDDDRPIQEWIDRANNYQSAGKHKKPIQQFDLNMNLIAEYDSAADAARALNKKDKSNICRAARKGCKAYNSYWKYKLDK